MPDYFGSAQMLDSVAPAGTRCSASVVDGANEPLLFRTQRGIFRGQAYLNLTFRSLEMDGRIIPVQMSILAFEKPRGEANGKRRKDVRIEEGQVVEAKHDLKGDLAAGAIGTGGGTFIGMVFSHALRGFGIGFAGSAIYIAARRGKEVELPAQTGILVRTDNNITVPAAAGSGSGYVSNRQ